MDTKGKKILIADDEPDILEILQYNLAAEGYQVITAKDGDEAIEKARAFHPELIVLDIMMPKKNGIEVCNILRMQPAFGETLIIFLTALSDEKNQIHGLETGADDYVSKPISPKVLISRVNALFRRTRRRPTEGVAAPLPGNTIQVGDLMIDKEKFLVNYQQKDITLAKKEFELLALLASRPGRVFLRNEILSQVWGTDVIVGDRTIDVHIRKIRQKLEVDCITTVKGVGYKFEL
ncbi:response regulator transcription factor [Dinghuibacter silviterrae]|uniref:Phosphate regulon transcriptional regulatory protein PhoB n=1 Tax=Dinghuibacter silviterrae TaxID=1539049 RepID=A0A4R8DSJ6_9BACT|nr:response regulator transcription factor [Dinghuibacter silviterrae]TDX00131.1 two-component system alkaline phosphatase synthesis response regulator PhoP [Dinghuibacter silviterrae]